MSTTARWGVLLATLLGLAAAVWAFGETGVGSVVAVARRVGVGGFVLYCVYSLTVYAWLGGSWLAAAPGEPIQRLGAFVWARLIREAVADLLPFSQIGGLVVGTRTLAAHGVAMARVIASLIADMATEMASQLVFTLFGLAMLASLLIGGHEAASLRPLILGGTAAMTAIVVAFVLFQRRALRFVAGIAARVLPGSFEVIDGIGGELDRIYARRNRILLAFVLNLGGWIGSAAGAWILLRLIGVELSIWSVLSLESLIFMLRSVAFAVPGAIGFQEAAYALAGPLVGLPAEIALAISLAKRARDLAIGLPALLVWQIAEARQVVRSTARSTVP